MNDKERQAKSRDLRKQKGAKQITVMLDPSAAAALQSFLAKGETIAGCINRLLIQSHAFTCHQGHVFLP